VHFLSSPYERNLPSISSSLIWSSKYLMRNNNYESSDYAVSSSLLILTPSQVYVPQYLLLGCYAINSTILRRVTMCSRLEKPYKATKARSGACTEGSIFVIAGLLHKPQRSKFRDFLREDKFSDYLIILLVVRIWFRIGTSRGLLWTRQWTLRFHKILGSWQFLKKGSGPWVSADDELGVSLYSVEWG
jgi:hypothetical protein